MAFFYPYTQNDALKAVQMQTIFALCGGVLFFALRENAAGLAYFCGSMVCLVANIFMYRCVFSRSGARQAKKIIAAFYRAEVGKILLTAAGFAGGLLWGLVPVWLFIGYILTQCVFWLFPVCWAITEKKRINKWDVG